MKQGFLLICLITFSCAHHKPSKRVLVNQIGYPLEGKKQAIVLTDQRRSFQVINKKDGKSVYQGTIEKIVKDDVSKEVLGYLDFSSIRQKGNFYISVDQVGESAPFVLQRNPYHGLLKELLRNLYLHRAGENLLKQHAGKWSRNKFAVKECYLFDNPQIKKNCEGGWYDAGDFGRYAVPTAVLVGYLLQSYQFFPSSFSDDLNIPESGNGISDILDEAKVGLNFLFKLQDKNGGVYHKVTTKKFAPFGLKPSSKKYYEAHKVYFFRPTLAATLNSAAAMALASRVYKEIDPTFSKKALRFSLKAWRWAKKHSDDPVFENPQGVKTGLYDTAGHQDERFWATIELYLATKTDHFWTTGVTLIDRAAAGSIWAEVGVLGSLSYLKSGRKDFLTEHIRARILKWAKTQEGLVRKSPWGVIFDGSRLRWNSNGIFAFQGISEILGNGFQKREKETILRQEALNYLLGQNPLARSFVSGVGHFQIEHPHHRLSFLHKKVMRGMVIGGVNEGLQDPVAKSRLSHSPRGKRHIDNIGSYSTNENAIDLNGYWIFLVSSLVDLHNSSTKRL